MIRKRLLLDSTPTDGGAPQAPAPVTPQAPSVPRTVTPKPGVNPPPKALPAESKDFQFKIDEPSLLQDQVGDTKSDVVDLGKAKTPLDVANQMIADGKEKTAPKAEPTDKTPVVQPEVKPVVPKAAVVEKPTVQPIAPKSKTPAAEFDYTGFNEQEQYVLKNMSVQAREHVIKVMKENKELAGMKQAQFMQHPDAYVLDPQFSTLQEDVLYYNKEAQFWQEQLIKISNGEKWTPLKAWDKQGNPIVEAEQVPTKLAEEQARINMNRLIQAASGKEQELRQFAGSYKQRVQQDSQNIQNERARRFGWVADPKILESTLTLDGDKEVTVKECRETMINLFPPYLRQTIGVEVAADLFTAFQIQQEHIRELEAGQTQVQQQAQQTFRAEPTSERKASEGVGKVVGGVKEFSLAGMPS